MMKLSGKRRYRSDDDGRLILQVQEYRCTNTGLPLPDEDATWRDARTEDLSVYEVER